MKSKCRGIIKSYDVSQPDVIDVVYSKIPSLPYSWEDIKSQVENELVHFVRFYPKTQDDSNNNEKISKEDLTDVLNQFLEAN